MTQCWRILVLGLVLVSGCRAVRDQNRFQVSDDASRPLIASRYEPESDYNCRELGSYQCPYIDNPLKDPIKACGEHATPEARRVGANYVFVDLPNSMGVGDLHFKLGGTTAHLLGCANLP
jgi:hypothetical protein